MPNIGPLVQYRKKALLLVGLAFCSKDSLAQQFNSSNPPDPSTPVQNSQQFVSTITDPYTGKQYDRYRVQEMVPVSVWKQEKIIERRAVPRWVTENVKVAETQYVPFFEYQPQQRILNRWNPFGPPQVILEYVPVTRYQAIATVAERPQTFQKYEEQNVEVLVPKLVQSTQATEKWVDRERTPNANGMAAVTSANPIQNAADLAMANRNSQLPRYTTHPMDGWYSGTPVPAGAYPYSAFGNIANAPRQPYYGNSSPNLPMMFPGGTSPIVPMSQNPNPQAQLVSNQAIVPPVSYATPNHFPAMMPASNAYASNPPLLFQWPSWSNNNGPLFRQDWFRQNQTAPYGTQPISGTIYPSYPTIANQSTVNGYLRPSTSPLMPQATSPTWGTFGGSESYRDPIQAGIPPTVLR